MENFEQIVEEILPKKDWPFGLTTMTWLLCEKNGPRNVYILYDFLELSRKFKYISTDLQSWLAGLEKIVRTGMAEDVSEEMVINQVLADVGEMFRTIINLPNIFSTNMEYFEKEFSKDNFNKMKEFCDLMAARIDYSTKE